MEIDGNVMELLAYVIMPNHVHLMIKTIEDYTLGQIVWSWKSYTTKMVFKIDGMKDKILKSLESKRRNNFNSTAPEKIRKYISAEACGAPRKVSLWNREYWDRFIRDENHYNKAIQYIHNNPVKAGLVDDAADWKWSSIKLDRSV